MPVYNMHHSWECILYMGVSYTHSVKYDRQIDRQTDRQRHTGIHTGLNLNKDKPKHGKLYNNNK